MRMLSLTFLATLVVVTSLAEPVDAGRRRRRTRRVAAVAGVAAVAAARPRTVVAPAVVPAPVVVRGAAVVAPPVVVPQTPVALLPDLTVTKISTEAEVHCITVKNVGQAASPETTMRIEFQRSLDGVIIASKEIRVAPLRVNQTVRFRLHLLPPGTSELIATVDPDNKVAEISEQNNDLFFQLAKPQPEVAPAPLEDVDIWVLPPAAAAEPADVSGE